MAKITVNDELTFDVDENFFKLSPAQQQKIVDEAVIQDATSGAGRAFLKGMMFNFRDEVAAILSEPTSALEYAMGGEGAEFAERLTRERALESAFLAREPVTALASELAGGVVIPGGALGTAARGATMLGKAARAGGIGAGFGALSGAGAGEGVEGRAVSAGIGGAIGAPLGIASAAAVPALGAITAPVARTAGRLVEAGVSAPQNRAARMIARRLKEAGVSGKELEALKASPKPEVLADIDSAGIESLSRLIAQSGGRGSELAKVLNARQFGDEAIEGAAQRIEADLIAAGVPKTSARQAQQGLSRIKQEKAGAVYEKAFSQPVTPQMRSEMKPIYDRIKSTGALANAKRIASTEGRAFAGEPLDSLTFEDLQYIQRSLRSVSSQAYSSGNAELGNAVNALRKELIDVMDKYNPDFKQARSIYAGAEANNRALQAGRDFQKLRDKGEISEVIAGMGEDELHHFRTGVAQTIRNNIEGARTSANFADRIAGSQRQIRQLEEVFPKDQFAKLKEALNVEANMARKRQKIMGGSQTFQTLQAGAEATAEDLSMIERGLSGTRTGGIFGGITAAVEPKARQAMLAVGPETSEALGEMLFAADPAKRAEAIRRIMRTRAMEEGTPMGLLGQVGRAMPSPRTAARGLLFQTPLMMGQEISDIR